MSIERLNMAASAAGYAMANPDDDAIVDTPPEAKVSVASSRAVVVAEPQRRVGVGEALSGLTTWAKGYWAGFGWRQPA
jgi:hypothetical protein